jgi:hypothetical protein
MPLRCSHNRSDGGPTPHPPGFYIAAAGEGGNLVPLLPDPADFPLPLQPHPPESADIHRPVAITRLLKSILQNLSVWVTIRRFHVLTDGQFVLTGFIANHSSFNTSREAGYPHTGHT